MIWKSMPLAFRFSLAYALVFLLAMVAGAQTYAPVVQPVPQFRQTMPQPPQNYVAAPYYSAQAYQPPPPMAAAYQPPQQAPGIFPAPSPGSYPSPGAYQPPLASVPGQWGAPVVASGARFAALTKNRMGVRSHVASMGAGQPYGAGVGCDSCDTCAPAACCRTVAWGGRVGVLLLDRNDENHRMFSYDSLDESYQLLDSRDANFDIGTGVEARIGRFDCCSQKGCEIAYWGIYPGEDSAYAYPTDVTGDLNAIFNFDQLDYNGTTADSYANTALVHRMRRETEIHSAEINWLWGLPLCGGQCSPWQFRALAGLRYFRLADNLQFASDTVDTVFTGAVEELYYDIDVDNDLLGFQFGGTGLRRIGCSRWTASCGVKAGAFVNHADANSYIGGAAGAATINNGPNAGRAWDISASKDAVAFLGEMQAGIGCQLGYHWRLFGEYRVVGISGAALPSNQIYQDLRGLQDVQLLAANGSLILHGGLFGLERVY